MGIIGLCADFCEMQTKIGNIFDEIYNGLQGTKRKGHTYKRIFEKKKRITLAAKKTLAAFWKLHDDHWFNLQKC